jgi:hypothetical protein
MTVMAWWVMLAGAESNSDPASGCSLRVCVSVISANRTLLTCSDCDYSSYSLQYKSGSIRQLLLSVDISVSVFRSGKRVSFRLFIFLFNLVGVWCPRVDPLFYSFKCVTAPWFLVEWWKCDSDEQHAAAHCHVSCAARRGQTFRLVRVVGELTNHQDRWYISSAWLHGNRTWVSVA